MVSCPQPVYSVSTDDNTNQILSTRVHNTPETLCQCAFWGFLVKIARFSRYMFQNETKYPKPFQSFLSLFGRVVVNVLKGAWLRGFVRFLSGDKGVILAR